MEDLLLERSRPSARIKEIEGFYATGSSTVFLQMDENTLKGLSVDQKGQWLLQQLEQAAEQAKILPFLTKEMDIPIIEDEETYVSEFLAPYIEELREDHEALLMKEDQLILLKQDYVRSKSEFNQFVVSDDIDIQSEEKMCQQREDLAVNSPRTTSSMRKGK